MEYVHHIKDYPNIKKMESKWPITHPPRPCREKGHTAAWNVNFIFRLYSLGIKAILGFYRGCNNNMAAQNMSCEKKSLYL